MLASLYPSWWDLTQHERNLIGAEWERELNIMLIDFDLRVKSAGGPRLFAARLERVDL